MYADMPIILMIEWHHHMKLSATLFIVFLIAVYTAVGGPICPTSEMGTCDHVETEAARFDLLQRATALDVKRSSIREETRGVYKPQSVKGCPSFDAASVTFEDLVAMEVPTVLKNAFPGLDPSFVSRSNFVGQGQWANLSVDYDSFIQGPNDTFMSVSEKTTVSEYLNRFESRNVKLQPTQTAPWIQAILDAFDGEDPLGFKIMQSNMVLDGVNEYFGVLSQKNQVSPVHTHNTALVAQISGSKGWIWGNTGTYGYGDAASGASGWIPSNPPSDEQICDVWRAENQTAFSPEKFLFCESEPGDVMVGPGLCGGRCGWWHATCGLDDWQVGLVRVGPFRDDSGRPVGIRGPAY